MILRSIIGSIVISQVLSKIIVDGEKATKESRYYDGKKTNIPISQQDGIDLMQHWLDQAFSGLMAAVATKKLAHLRPEFRRQIHECNKKAKTTQEHAQCVVKTLDLVKDPRNLVQESQIKRKEMTTKRPNYFSSMNRKRNYSSQIIHSITSSKKRRLRLKKIMNHDGLEDFYAHHRIEKHENFAESFRRSKRAVHNRASYTISHPSDRSPLGIISRQITQAVRKLKGKENQEEKNWKTVIVEITEKARELKNREKLRKMMRKRNEFYAKAGRRADRMDLEINQHRPLAMPELDEMDERFDREELLAQTRKQMRNMTEEQRIITAPMKLLREAVKIGLTMAGKNVSDFEKKDLNLISPRLFSILPEDKENKKDQISLLSPSLFSLHDDGDGLEGDLSLPKTLKSIGLKSDTQDLMDMIIEVSGVGEAIDKVKKSKFSELDEKDEVRGADGQPLYWSKENASHVLDDYEMRKIDVMEQLQRMYTPRQMEEMREQGFTGLTPRQLDFVYGPKSPYNDTQALKRFMKANLSRPVIESSIHHAIQEVALGEASLQLHHHQIGRFEASRRKDIVLSPVLFQHFVTDPTTVSQPLILSPVLFSSLIISPAVFGAIILSPWVFVAAIISPRILSPVVLTPFMFVPLILTPLALTPVILSPGIFNPFVLSPLLLSPFILSPQAFTPLILSPFALTPFILTPNLMSPLVLSPFVLSPIILSPAYVSAVILSPFALSPAIASTGAIVTVAASPSFLS